MDENVKMKTHQNLLDGELKRLETRMSRLHEMIAKERKLNGAINVKHFDKEIDNLIDENTDLKIENKRLKKIIGGLRAKVSSLTNKSNA